MQTLVIKQCYRHFLFGSTWLYMVDSRRDIHFKLTVNLYKMKLFISNNQEIWWNLLFYKVPILTSLVIDNYEKRLKNIQKLLFLYKSNLLILATYRYVSSFERGSKQILYLMKKLAYIICLSKWYTLLNIKKREDWHYYCWSGYSI